MCERMHKRCREAWRAENAVSHSRQVLNGITQAVSYSFPICQDRGLHGAKGGQNLPDRDVRPIHMIIKIMKRCVIIKIAKRCADKHADPHTVSAL